MCRPTRYLSARKTPSGEYQVVRTVDGWDIIGLDGFHVGPFKSYTDDGQADYQRRAE